MGLVTDEDLSRVNSTGISNAVFRHHTRLFLYVRELRKNNSSIISRLPSRMYISKAVDCYNYRTDNVSRGGFTVRRGVY